MPVENEVKYVLTDPKGDLESFLERSAGVEVYDILQVYLDKDSRIRRLTPLAGGPSIHVFTFKRKVGGKQIEIETEISERDFESLLPTAEIVLEKRRFKLPGDDGVAWDVDFLKSSGGTYFVLAEAEMADEDAVQPGEIPAFIKAHLLRYVGRRDGFGNKKLADETYARKVFKTLKAASKVDGSLPSCDPSEYDGAGAVLRAA